MRRRIVTAVVTCLTVILLAGVIDKVLDMQNTKNSIKVGFIYIGDESNAYSYNFIKAQNALSHTYDGQIETSAKYNVPEYAVAAPVEELVQEGCDLIFSTSYGYEEKVKRSKIS